MHVTLLPDLLPGKEVIPVYISSRQLDLLCTYVYNSFRLNNESKPLTIQAKGYGDDDLFFDAEGKFSIFKSCNVWTNEGLKSAGIRCSEWTPFDKPILYQLSCSRK